MVTYHLSSTIACYAVLYRIRILFASSTPCLPTRPSGRCGDSIYAPVLSPSFPPTRRQVSQCPRSSARHLVLSPLFSCNRHSQPSSRSNLRGRSSMLHPLPLRLHSTCKKHTRHTGASSPPHLTQPHRNTLSDPSVAAYPIPSLQPQQRNAALPPLHRLVLPTRA
jgi:hypothetical protein